MFRVRATSVAPLLLLSGCSWLSASELRDVRVVPDVCGNFVVEVDATAPGRKLVIEVDGAVQERLRVDGAQTLRWLGHAAAGTRPRVKVRLADRAFGELEQLVSIAMPAYESAVTVEQNATRLYEGAPGGFDVAVSDVCSDLASPTWTLSVDDREVDRGTMLPANRTAHIEHRTVEGAHRLTVAVTLSPHRVEQRALAFYVEPPCADEDEDGLTTCDGDCDDGDPDVQGCPDSGDLDADGYIAISAGGTDCNDQLGAVHPDQPDGPDLDGDGYHTRNGRDDDCDGQTDEDAAIADCDDTDPRVSPALAEHPVPNGKDDNCDGRIDEGTRVFDDDGDGYSEDEGDCDDADVGRSPGNAEADNCRDDNCNSQIDEGVDYARVDDSYESNDTQGDAHDLGGRSRNKFGRTLELVARDSGDDEWFEFYSDDGLFDSWYIKVSAQRLPDDSLFDVSLYRGSALVRSGRFASDDASITLRGRGAVSDSGTYRFRVRPVRTPRPYCPFTISMWSN